MATDPFADIKFRENFSQAYYTEVIIARQKQSRRFCDQTPTVTQSFKRLLSNKYYKICETLALPGPNPTPLQLENQLQYKKDQPYSLYDQGQLEDPFRIQNAITPLYLENEASYWNRVSAPLTRKWLQEYVGYRTLDGKKYPIFIRGLYTTLNKNLNYYTSAANGFSSGIPETNANYPNKYRTISLTAIVENEDDSNTTVQNARSRLSGQSDQTPSSVIQTPNLDYNYTIANVIIPPGKYQSTLAYDVHQTATAYDSSGAEILTSIGTKSKKPYYSGTQEVASGATDTYSTTYDEAAVDFPAEEFTIAINFYPQKTVLFYGAWIITILPKDGNKTFTLDISLKRYYNSTTISTFALEPSITTDFTIENLGRMNLLTIKYRYTPKEKKSTTTGQTIVNNNGLEMSDLEINLNTTPIFSRGGQDGLAPPRVIEWVLADYPPNTYPDNTIMDFCVNTALTNFIMISEGWLSSENVYKLYSHILRYERALPDVPVATVPPLPPTGGGSGGDGGGGGVPAISGRVSFDATKYMATVVSALKARNILDGNFTISKVILSYRTMPNNEISGIYDPTIIDGIFSEAAIFDSTGITTYFPTFSVEVYLDGDKNNFARLYGILVPDNSGVEASWKIVSQSYNNVLGLEYIIARDFSIYNQGIGSNRTSLSDAYGYLWTSYSLLVNGEIVNYSEDTLNSIIDLTFPNYWLGFVIDAPVLNYGTVQFNIKDILAQFINNVWQEGTSQTTSWKYTGNGPVDGGVNTTVTSGPIRMNWIIDKIESVTFKLEPSGSIAAEYGPQLLEDKNASGNITLYENGIIDSQGINIYHPALNVVAKISSASNDAYFTITCDLTPTDDSTWKILSSDDDFELSKYVNYSSENSTYFTLGNKSFIIKHDYVCDLLKAVNDRPNVDPTGHNVGKSWLFARPIQTAESVMKISVPTIENTNINSNPQPPVQEDTYHYFYNYQDSVLHFINQFLNTYPVANYLDIQKITNFDWGVQGNTIDTIPLKRVVYLETFRVNSTVPLQSSSKTLSIEVKPNTDIETIWIKNDPVLEFSATITLYLDFANIGSDIINVQIQARKNVGGGTNNGGNFGGFAIQKAEEVFSKQTLPLSYKFAFVPYVKIACSNFSYFDGYYDQFWFRDEFTSPPTLTFKLTKSYWQNGIYYGTYEYVDQFPIIYEVAFQGHQRGDFDFVVGGFSVSYDSQKYEITPATVYDRLGKPYLVYGAVAIRANYLTKLTSYRILSTFKPTTGSVYDAQERFYVDTWDTTKTSFNPNDIKLTIPVDASGNYFNANCYSCSGTVTGTIPITLNMKSDVQPYQTPPLPPTLNPATDLAANINYTQSSVTPSPGTPPSVNPPTLSPNYKFQFAKATKLHFYGKFQDITVNLEEIDPTQTNAKYSYVSYTNNVLIVAGFSVTYTPNTSFRITPLDVYVPILDKTFKCFGVINYIYDDQGNVKSFKNIHLKPNGGAGGVFGDQDWRDNNFSTLANWYYDQPQDADGNIFNTDCYGTKCGLLPKQTGVYVSTSTIITTEPSTTKVALPNVYGTGQDVAGLPLAAGQTDPHYTISDVLLAETKPDRYWKFNNSLKDEYSALSFSADFNSLPNYTAGKVVDASGATRAIYPTIPSYNYYPAYLTVNDSTLFNNRINWTVSGWVKAPYTDPGIPPQMTAMTLGSSLTNRGIRLVYSYTTPTTTYIAKHFNLEIVIPGPVAIVVQSITINASVEQGEFAFFVIKNEQGVIKASINNSPFVSVDNNLDYQTYYSPTAISYDSISLWTFADDLRIYNKIISDSELAYLYNAATTTQYLPAPGTPIQGTGIPREYNTPFIAINSALKVQDQTKWPLVKSSYYDDAWWPANVPNDQLVFDSYNARWISYSTDASTLSNKLTAGFYKIKTSIDFSGYMLDSIELELAITADDMIHDIVINGKSTGLNNVAVGGIPATGSQYDKPRFYNIWNVVLPTGASNLWKTGVNTIEFAVTASGLTGTDQNPFGIFVGVRKAIGVALPPATYIDYYADWDQTKTVPKPPKPPVSQLPPPPPPPQAPPSPPLTPADQISRSSDCITLDSFTYNILGPIVNTSFNRSSPIIVNIDTLTPTIYGEDITDFGFQSSAAKWVRNQSDPNNTCGFVAHCTDPAGSYPFEIMAQNTTITKTINMPADSWITIQFRQTTPPPGYQLVTDNNGIEITLNITSPNGTVYTRTIKDVQTLYGKPTKRVLPPLYNAVLDYDNKPVDVQIVIRSSGAIFEHYIDDIVIEYGPGYCSQLNCIDAFTGNSKTQKYFNTIKTPWSRRGSTELNFGSGYYIPAGKTASQTIRLGGYLNKDAKVSVVISGYSVNNTAGITALLETFDENMQPLEGFSDRLFINHKGSLITTNTFDNNSDIDNYTVSTFTLGQACKIIKVQVTSASSDFHIGFIDICSDQSITLEKIEPLVNCKGNVNDLKVSLNINGVPREEVNIFQAFCKYSVLTNTTSRTNAVVAIPPKMDGRIGTSLPTSCEDSKLCNYWKQQGTADGVTQTVIAHTVTDNGTPKDLYSIEEGSYNNLRTIDNFIWAAPLTSGFAPDQYILSFGQTPNNIAEDNFVESIDVYISANRVSVANSRCLQYGSAYPFAKYITLNADTPLLTINIPQNNFQNPEVLSFELVSSTMADGVTTANYVLTDIYCFKDTVVTGGFSIEHHPEDGEYFLIKPYDWSKSPKNLFGYFDFCANHIDYTNFVTMGALGTLKNGAIFDDTLTEIDIKPDNLSLDPAGKRYWVKKIMQSSTIDLFSISFSGYTEPVTLFRVTGLGGTAGTEYDYNDSIQGSFGWYNDPVNFGTEGYIGLCQDPADSLTVTIEYTDNLGQLKTFSKDIALADIYPLDTINQEDWNKLSAYGNGVKGDFGMWVKASFVLDNVLGTGLDQCLPVPTITPKNSDPVNVFPHFTNESKGANLGLCEPSIVVFEAIPGAADNEIQSIIIPVATDGFFAVSFDYNGSYSAEVPFNVDADGFRASLASLANIGSTDNVKVSGSGTANAPFVVEFIGSLALTSLPLLRINTTNLKCAAVTTVTYLSVGSNSERQRITKTTDTRSPLIISYDGYFTGNIPYNASVNAMQTALSLIPSLGSNIKVFGEIVDNNAAYTGPWYFDFINDLAGRAMQPLRPIVAGYTQDLLWSGVTGVNTKQRVAITADSGTYTITLTDTVNGVNFNATTDRIPLTATAEEISNFITTAANFIASSDISIKITSSSSGYLEWTIEFIGNYSKLPVQKITIDATYLTRSEQATITRLQTGLGVNERQRLGVSRVTGGYYYLKITIGGVTQTTAEIPYDATDVKLEQLISNLSFFTTGDVIVRHDPLQEGEYRAYTISFNDKFGNVPAIEPVYQGYLICNPALLIAGPPYNYKVPVCAQDPLSLTNTNLICKPGPNDGSTPLPVDCCTPAKTGDNTVNLIAYERELFNPATKLNGTVVTVKQLAASRRISPTDYNVYIRDFRTNAIRPSNWDAQIMSGISLVFIEKQVDTPSGQREIITHLSNSQELLPTRMLGTTKNQAIIQSRNKLYG